MPAALDARQQEYFHRPHSSSCRAAAPWAPPAPACCPVGHSWCPPGLTGYPSHRGRRGGRAGPSAKIADRIGQPDQHQDGRRPAEHDQQAVEQSEDRKSGVEGKSVSVRVDHGSRRITKKKKETKKGEDRYDIA